MEHKGRNSCMPLSKVWLSLNRFSRNSPLLDNFLYRTTKLNFVKIWQGLAADTTSHARTRGWTHVAATWRISFHSIETPKNRDTTLPVVTIWQVTTFALSIQEVVGQSYQVTLHWPHNRTQTQFMCYQTRLNKSFLFSLLNQPQAWHSRIRWC